MRDMKLEFKKLKNKNHPNKYIYCIHLGNILHYRRNHSNVYLSGPYILYHSYNV